MSGCVKSTQTGCVSGVDAELNVNRRNVWNLTSTGRCHWRDYLSRNKRQYGSMIGIVTKIRTEINTKKLNKN
jgi:hypothetical protein